ncbi:MAG: hypothetical protein JWM68_2438 [Verrucomicrobiales bacterium]|nr:hypothetical protein [Verrucomicrobiales bacterium]
MERIWVGTSGWVYKHWAASFYPSNWPKKGEFQFYATQFPTVEINATFYRLPTENMVKGWHEKAPDHFLFAVKGSRFITHIKRLKETGAPLEKYFERIIPLQEHLGPILWQLAPNFHNNPENLERVENFLKALPRQFRHALEFRHPSWVETSTYEILSKYSAANVWLSSQRMPVDFTITADFVYLRFHGLANGAAHDYSEEELKPWAERLIGAAEQGKPCFVYFNNDWNTRAPSNAKTLMELVGNLAVAAFTEDPVLARRVRPTTRSRFREPRSKRLRSIPTKS